MLHEFVTRNHAELVERCKGKATRRTGSPELPVIGEHGVPLFLRQLVDALRAEQSSPSRDESQAAPSPTPIGRAAALHGAELLRKGYSVDQVVHGYGDICQAVTELALDRNEPIPTDDFRVMNRCLDNAIADAVTAYGERRQLEINSDAEALGGRLDDFWHEQQKQFDIAIQSFMALQTGKLGLTGATAVAHLHSRQALRAAAQMSVSEARRDSAKTTLPPFKT
jgi:hypothetical protein